MESLDKVLLNLIEPMVDDVTSVSVKELPSLDEDEKVLCVYAKGDDIARLIGRRGNMANALRQVMNIAGRVTDQRVIIKFESYE